MMKEVVLDGAAWKCGDDVYDSFFKSVGAPPWHGRNFDALNDSIATGGINQIELPYRIVVRNYASIGTGAKKMTADFINLIHEISGRGHPGEIRVE